jgi:flagellar biosynthetic protein FliR
MTIDTPLVPGSMAVLILMSVRIGLVITLIPGLSGRSVPAQGKVALTVLLALMLSPFVRADAIALSQIDRFVLALAQELLVGLALGLAVSMVFSAVEMAASLISFQLGFSLANVFNPSLNLQGTALTTFYLALAALLLFVTNGHHLLLLALQRSFETIPLGQVRLSPRADAAVLELSAMMFADALRIGLPIAGTLLIADVALGILNRMVPQMSVFFVGLPAKIFAGLLLLALTLPFLLRVLSDVVNRQLGETMLRMLQVLQ